MKTILRISILILLTSFTMCKPNKTLPPVQNATMPLVVYKTKADYSKLVPIALNKDKDQVIYYPAPGDIVYEGNPAHPVKLNKGYWLDNTGIGPNSVFTSYTFEAYAALKQSPSIDQLMESIVDMDPFEEVWHCGSRSHIGSIKELNAIVESGFKGCKRLK